LCVWDKRIGRKEGINIMNNNTAVEQENYLKRTTMNNTEAREKSAIKKKNTPPRKGI